MEITEQRLMEVFGLEGGKEQEPAEPAPEQEERQEPEEDLTEGGQAADNESDGEPAEEQEPITDTGSETNGQSEEERRAKWGEDYDANFEKMGSQSPTWTSSGSGRNGTKKKR